MWRPLLSALCLVMVAGCGEGFPRLPMSPGDDTQVPPPVVGSSALPQAIQVGDVVGISVPPKGGDAYNFALVAPRDGTLVARVTWEAPKDFLQVWVGGTVFGAHSRNGDEDPDLAPYSTVDGKRSLVGSVPVIGGRSYRIEVASVPGYYDYGSWLQSSFTLTTSMQ